MPRDAPDTGDAAADKAEARTLSIPLQKVAEASQGVKRIGVATPSRCWNALWAGEHVIMFPLTGQTRYCILPLLDETRWAAAFLWIWVCS